MAATFLSLFSCCLRRRRKDPNVPDEESRLIPAETSEPTAAIPNVVVVDHQKLNARLSTIVRAKEGKMVNVNAQIPFNLHNQSITMDPSSSRSASISTNNRYEFPPRLGHSGLSAMPPPPSNLASSSRAPSDSRSSSSASLHYDFSRRGSLAPSETNDFRNPTLNVRLVNKGYGSVISGNALNRRGRPRVRGGGEGRVISAEPSNGNSGTSTQEQKGKEKDLEADSQLQPYTSQEEGDIPKPIQEENTPVPPHHIPNLSLTLNPEELQPKPSLPVPGFKINAAEICLSWGD